MALKDPHLFTGIRVRKTIANRLRSNAVRYRLSKVRLTDYLLEKVLDDLESGKITVEIKEEKDGDR